LSSEGCLDLFGFLRLPQAVIAHHYAVARRRQGVDIEGMVVGRGHPPENRVAAFISVDRATRGAFASGPGSLVNELSYFRGEIEVCHRFTLP